MLAATVVLKGTISSGRGAYAQGQPVEVDIAISTTARSATGIPPISAAVASITVKVNGTVVATATAPFNALSSARFQLLPIAIP